jgi:hypothetical protein
MRVSAVRYFNSSTIMCITPGSKYYKRVNVTVTNNGLLSQDDFVPGIVICSSILFIYRETNSPILFFRLYQFFLRYSYADYKH